MLTIAVPRHQIVGRDINLSSARTFCPHTGGMLISKGAILLPSNTSGCYGNDPQGAARAADNFEGCGNHDGAGWRKLIKVGKTG